MGTLLLRFFLLGAALILGVLPLAALRRDRKTAIRSLTLFALLCLIVGAIWTGPVGFGLLCAAILLLGCREAGLPAWLTVAALVLFGALTVLPPLPPALLVLPPLVGLLALLLGRRLVGRRWFPPALALGLLAPGAASLARLAQGGAGALLGLILLVQLNDAIGYLVGSRLGRVHPFPAISPNKSVEGYFGGALAVALGVAVLRSPLLPLRPGSTAAAALALGAYVLLTANLGDLTFSALKRARGVKDFGSLLPGHGGVLDRFGNFLMAAPLFALAWRVR